MTEYKYVVSMSRKPKMSETPSARPRNNHGSRFVYKNNFYPSNNRREEHPHFTVFYPRTTVKGANPNPRIHYTIPVKNRRSGKWIDSYNWQRYGQKESGGVFPNAPQEIELNILNKIAKFRTWYFNNSSRALGGIQVGPNFSRNSPKN